MISLEAFSLLFRLPRVLCLSSFAFSPVCARYTSSPVKYFCFVTRFFWHRLVNGILTFRFRHELGNTGHELVTISNWVSESAPNHGDLPLSPAAIRAAPRHDAPQPPPPSCPPLAFCRCQVRRVLLDAPMSSRSGIRDRHITDNPLFCVLCHPALPFLSCPTTRAVRAATPPMIASLLLRLSAGPVGPLLASRLMSCSSSVLAISFPCACHVSCVQLDGRSPAAGPSTNPPASHFVAVMVVMVIVAVAVAVNAMCCSSLFTCCRRQLGLARSSSNEEGE